MQKLKGLATGIGSLPFKEPEAALDLIFKYLRQSPFWPQLPKRDVREGMIAQFSEGFPCIKVTGDGIFFNAAEKEKELEVFYGRIIAGDIDYFRISEDFASGLYRFYQRLEKHNLKNIEFIKCQVTGPFTFAAAVNDDRGIALLHDKVFMQVILKALVMKALWQIRLFKKFGKRIILFVDEPFLGCFGSGYTPINREDVIKGLSEFGKEIKSEGVLLGVHCCGNTDWSIFTDTQEIDIINFDAFGFLDRLVLYADNLKNFFKRGGMLCWGIVPTGNFSVKETTKLLTDKIKEGLNILINKGLGKNLLLDNLLLSPACGLGSLSTDKAEPIFKALYEVSTLVKNLS